jgi:hypothetical protein
MYDIYNYLSGTNRIDMLSSIFGKKQMPQQPFQQPLVDGDPQMPGSKPLAAKVETITTNDFLSTVTKPNLLKDYRKQCWEVTPKNAAYPYLGKFVKYHLGDILKFSKGSVLLELDANNVPKENFTIRRVGCFLGGSKDPGTDVTLEDFKDINKRNMLKKQCYNLIHENVDPSSTTYLGNFVEYQTGPVLQFQNKLILSNDGNRGFRNTTTKNDLMFKRIGCTTGFAKKINTVGGRHSRRHSRRQTRRHSRRN